LSIHKRPLLSIRAELYSLMAREAERNKAIYSTSQEGVSPVTKMMDALSRLSTKATVIPVELIRSSPDLFPQITLKIFRI
jgi:hypothetical protein